MQGLGSLVLHCQFVHGNFSYVNWFMPQLDRNSQKENRQRGSEPNFNWRGVVLIVIAFSLIAMAMLFYRGGMQPVEDVPYNRFLELLENKQIVNDKNYPLQLVVEDGRPTQTLRGAYIRQGAGAAPSQPVPFRTTVYLSFTNNLQEKLAAAGMQPAIKTESNMLAQTLVGFLPIALFLLAGCMRSEEHTSELQSRLHLVCRLLLEKKKKNRTSI